MAGAVQSRVPFGLAGNFVLPPGALRLLLAAMVMTSHVARIDIGRLAVLIFFYLSGYWTSKIWEEKFDGAALVRFYISRYLRIAPLYLMVMIAAAFALKQHLHLSNITLLGLASTGNDPTGVSWSLDIELEFYLLLPLIAGVFGVIPSWASIVATFAIGALGCWAEFRFGLLTIAKYLPAFALGSLNYYKAWTPSSRAASISIGLFAAFAVLTAFTPFLDRRTPNPFDLDIWSFFWMLTIIPYVSRSLTIRSTKLDRHMGNLSFPLYLVHLPTIWFLRDLTGTPHGIKWIAVKLSALVLAVGIAITIYVLLDRPIDAWRVRMTEGAKR